MDSLRELIERTVIRPVPDEIAAMARHAAAGHAGVAAVIAYGSCLRGVATTDSLIDLYVLTDGPAGISTNPLSRLACRLVPPNVYYAELALEKRIYRAKYAVLPLDRFASRMTASTANPYFWARFAQPVALVMSREEGERRAVVAALAEATRTMFANARALTASGDPLEIWTAGFAATYRTELRPEGASRAASLVAANADYYRLAAELLTEVAPRPANWPLRRFAGKLWSMARLAKAAFTFTGGADYIAWKIERHSGHRIELSAWQKRHPLLTGLILLPQLLRRGVVR